MLLQALLTFSIFCKTDRSLFRQTTLPEEASIDRAVFYRPAAACRQISSMSFMEGLSQSDFL